jgi:hypothetical protein
MALISVGAALPLELALHDGNTGKFPLAYVTDQAGAAVTGSPFTLTHLANGLYRNTAFTVLAANAKLTALFVTYNETGHTTESVLYSRVTETFDVETRVATVDTKIGSPVGASLSIDVAAVKADTVSALAKIGTPVGASLSIDVAAVKADTAQTRTDVANAGTTLTATNTSIAALSTKVGTPVGASVSADIAAVKADTASSLTNQATLLTRIGTPTGASLSVDVAAVKTDTALLNTNYTAARAAKIDNLDAAVSTRSTAAALALVQTDTTAITTKIGTPVGASLSVDVAAVKADTASALTKIGTPVGASVSVDIANTYARLGAPVGASHAADVAAVKADTASALTKIGTPVGASLAIDVAAVKADTGTLATNYTAARAVKIDNLDAAVSTRSTAASVAAVQTDTTSIVTKIGTPVGASLSVDVAAVKADTASALTKIGTPVGASLAVDVAGVKADTGTLTTNYTAARAVKIDNLDTAISTRAAAGAVSSVQTDTTSILSRIGTPVGSSLAADVSGVRSDTGATLTRIGTPVGASLSVDVAAVKADTGTLNTNYTAARAAKIDNLDAAVSTRSSATALAAVQTDTTALNTKIGTPVGASLSVDIANNYARLGAPVGASHAADVAAVKADTALLNTNYTAARAAKIDNLDAAVSTRSSATALAAVQTDTTALNTKIGTPVGASLSVDVAGVKADTASALTRIGTPVGASLSVDVAAVKADTGTLATNYTAARAAKIDNLDATVSSRSSAAALAAVQTDTTALNTKIGTPVGASLSVDVAGVKADTASALTRIGTPVGASLAIDVASVKADTATLSTNYTAARAVKIDNLDAAVSTRSSAAALAAVQTDTTLLNTNYTAARAVKIDNLDAAVSTRSSAAALTGVASQVTGVQSDTDDLQARLGLPTGATFAADIAGIKTDTAPLATNYTAARAANLDRLDAAISSREAEAAAATRASDTLTRLGLPNGASLSEDIGHIQTNVSTLTTNYTPERAARIDNLDAAVSSRSTAVAAAAISTAVASVQADTDDLQSRLGSPTGASFSADVASIKADTGALNTRLPAARAVLIDNLDATLSSRASGDALAAASAISSETRTTVNDIQNRIGAPVGASVSADIAAVKANAGSIIATLGGFISDSSAHHQENLDNFTQIETSLADLHDELDDDHVADLAAVAALSTSVSSFRAEVGTSFGTVLTAVGHVQTTIDPLTIAAISSSVWNEPIAGHTIPGTSGLYLDVTREAAVSGSALMSSVNGFPALRSDIANLSLAQTTRFDQVDGEIFAVGPQITAARDYLKTEVDENQLAIELVRTTVTSARADVLAELSTAETKIDNVRGDVSAIQNNTTARFIVPDRLVKPDTGTKTYEFHLRLYDSVGNPEAPDAAPTIRMRRIDTGVDIVTNAPMTQDGSKVGAYLYQYTIAAGSPEYPILVEAAVTENGVTRYVPSVTEVSSYDSGLGQLQSTVNSLTAQVTNVQENVNSGVYGLSALKTSQGTIVNEINENQTLITSVKAKTDLLTSTIAQRSDIDELETLLADKPNLLTIGTRLDLTRDQLRGPGSRTIAEVYDHFDLTGVLKQNDPRLNNLDALISSRSTLSAADVWGFGTKELTAISLPQSDIGRIWSYLGSQATTIGSLGYRLVTNLDAPVSSRAQAADVSEALSGVALETSLSALSGTVVTEANENEIKLNALQADVTAIRAKTGLIPSDPARAIDIATNFTALDSAIANLALTASTIKDKTDSIPNGLALEATVTQIPTNPLLVDDARLSRLDANISSRGTVFPADLAPLAKTSGMNTLYTLLEGKENAIQAAIASLTLIVQSIPPHPTGGAMSSEITATRSTLLSAIAALRIPAAAPTPAQIWGHTSRTLTIMPEIELDNMATKADLLALAPHQYVCKIGASFEESGIIHLITWGEKDGQRVATSHDCRIDIRNADGTLVTTKSQVTPNLHGVYNFTHSSPLSPNANYYVVIAMTIDGAVRTSQQGFSTIG